MVIKHRLNIALALSTFLLFAVSGRTAYACGGGASDHIRNLLARTQYVVKAQVVQVDDSRQNGVLHVESVLFGRDAPEFMSFVQLDAVRIRRRVEGDVSHNCDSYGDPLDRGLTAYFFVTRRPDGVYESMPFPWDPSFVAFSEEQATVRFYSLDDENRFVEHVLTEAEFVEFIAAFGADAPAEPDSGAEYARIEPVRVPTHRYPLPAPLLLIAEDGTRSVLPVDGGDPVEATDEFLRFMTTEIMGWDSTHWNEAAFDQTTCPGEGCARVSPDGINRARQRDGQVEWFGGDAEGQAFLFSSTGEAIAVWNRDRLEVYTLGWEKASQNFREVVLLNAATLAGGPPHSYQASWTPDGRMLAYSDADGLWLLDAYDDGAEPRLLLAAEESIIPFALGFSPLGRYVQVERGDERLTLDTVSGDVFPDGLVSPDDRLLLAFDTQAAEFNLSLCYLTPVRDCEPVVNTAVASGPDDSAVFSRFTQVAWRSPNSYVAAACAREDPERCAVATYPSHAYGGSWYPGELVDGDSFDLFERDALVAVVQDGFTLRIGGQTYDLSAALDSPVARVEWLQPLFYEID